MPHADGLGCGPCAGRFLDSRKGLASDSFKRACFNWGIGRELYTAPFIWIKRGDFTLKEGKCYDRFTVKGIGYTNGVITGLEIINQALNRIVYRWGTITEEAPEKPEQPDTDPDGTKAPEFTPPHTATNAKVSTTDRVPPLPNDGEKKQQEPSPVTVYLLGAMKELREIRRISPAQNNKLFAAQKEALIAEGLAPKKDLAEYTMEEAKALIEAMDEKFSPEGTEIKK